MKQTNSAIKFLMAQYRAIFNSAYFKGLAGAAIVTMAMAAGQAQAQDITNFDGADSNPAITANTSNPLNITAATTKNDVAFTLTITDGETHQVSGATAIAAVANSGTFVINGEKANKTKLTIGGSGSVSIKALDVKSGILDIKTENAKFEADSITLGQKVAPKAAAADSGTALVTLSGGATLGKATTDYQLYDGAVITLGGDAAKVLGKSLKAEGGKIDVKGIADWVVPFSDAQKLDVSVAGNKTLSVKVPLQDTVRGAIHFASGSTIDLVSDGTSGGKLDINASSNSGSVVILDKGVVLTSSGKDDNGGTISIAGGGADSGVAELQTDADVLT